MKVVLAGVVPVVAIWKVHCRWPAVTHGDAVPVTTSNVIGDPDDVPAVEVASVAVANPESVAVRPPVELM